MLTGSEYAESVLESSGGLFSKASGSNHASLGLSTFGRRPMGTRCNLTGHCYAVLRPLRLRGLLQVTHRNDTGWPRMCLRAMAQRLFILGGPPLRTPDSLSFRRRRLRLKRQRRRLMFVGTYGFFGASRRVGPRPNID